MKIIDNYKEMGTCLVKLKDAEGLVLAHDITEIVPEKKKKVAFRKGHLVSSSDLGYLKRLGKEHLYVLELDSSFMHENEAAEQVALALMRYGIRFSGVALEGKVDLVASYSGLFDLDLEKLEEVNMISDIICATVHRNTLVRKGQIVAGVRSIPLVIEREYVSKAMSIVEGKEGLMAVHKLSSLKTGVIVTGNEVVSGLVKDGFVSLTEKKLRTLGSVLTTAQCVPDNQEVIARSIKNILKKDIQLLIMTAGMSVDPDDVTRKAIVDAGGIDLIYGAPVLPGSMFLVGKLRKGNSFIPVLGVPACALFNSITILDLILPRIMTNEKITLEKISKLGHGGYCYNCVDVCQFPMCSFGKGS